MPGLVAFGRRWIVGSDDLFLPSIFLIIIHVSCLSMCIFSLIYSEAELFGEVNVESEHPNCGYYAAYLIVIKTTIMTFGILLDFTIMITSLRGTIVNDSPRKFIPVFIYMLLGLHVLDLIWSGFAVWWVFNMYSECQLNLTKQLCIGLMIVPWVVLFLFVLTAWCTYDEAGRTWYKLKRYQENLKEFEIRHPTYRRSGSTRNWRQRLPHCSFIAKKKPKDSESSFDAVPADLLYRKIRHVKVIRAYQNSWNHRCRLLFCCITYNERNRDSFTDLARLLSEFFRDLDVVPSDIITGLLLLRRLQRLEQSSIVKQKRNNTYEFLSGVPITSGTRFVALNDPGDSTVFHNVVHYMYYASAAYGWPWFIIPAGTKGLWKLCTNLRCCRPCFFCGQRSELEGLVIEDNCCYCNYAVIPTVFGRDAVDVIYATYHVDVGETAFFIVVDYEKETIVVSIRGTLSLMDVITDLNAEGEILPIDPPKEDWIGHKGMVQAAVYMRTKLITDGLLEKAFNHNPERKTENYQLVLVGHSLGAGTAAILAVLLKQQFPTLMCYAFSPPGGLLSMPVVEHTKEFVISVILGKDVVPRIGLSQMEALRADLINAIKKSKKPKWQTLFSGIVCCCCIKKEFARPQRPSIAPSIMSEEFMRTRRSLTDVREVIIRPNESAVSLTVHPPMFPPGKIMHIVRHHPKKHHRVVKKNEPVFQAIWTENEDYGQVLISPGMIQDHMPDQLLNALKRVVNNHGPAKPHRTNLNSSALQLARSRDSNLCDDNNGHIQPTRSSNPPPSSIELYKETSFNVNNECVNENSPDCTLMNPSPLILDADADGGIEGEITPTNNQGLTDILASLNMSWDYVTSLQERFLEKEHLIQQEQNQRLLQGLGKINCGGSSTTNTNIGGIRERKSSIGGSSTGYSEDAGSTFKEIFGPLKYDEWMCPLASPETLSEISSLSSRTSFMLPKDQSPLLRVKGGRNSVNNGQQSSSFHHKFKNGGSHNRVNGAIVNGKNDETNGHHHHQRSFSCSSAPEVSISNEDEQSRARARMDQSFTNQDYDQQQQSQRGAYESEYTSNSNSNSNCTYEEINEEMNPGNCFEPPASPNVTSSGSTITDDSTTIIMRRNGSGSKPNKQVSFNLTNNKNTSQPDHTDTDQGFDSTSSPISLSQFVPTYPLFHGQEEYGRECVNSPHYFYSSEEPFESPTNGSPHTSHRANLTTINELHRPNGFETTANDNDGQNPGEETPLNFENSNSIRFVFDSNCSSQIDNDLVL